MSLLPRLSFNQMTADPWSLEQAVRNCSANGIPYIGVWRHKMGGDAEKASAMIRREGLRVSSLCRGGLVSGDPPRGGGQRIEDNHRGREEAPLLDGPGLWILSGPPDG